MLGLLLLYVLGKWLHNLAKKFEKPIKWIYPVLAILTYMVVGVLSVLIIMLITEINGSEYFLNMDSNVLGLLAIPFGVGGVWLLHFLLKRAWSQQKSQQMDDAALLDVDVSEDDLI